MRSRPTRMPALAATLGVLALAVAIGFPSWHRAAPAPATVTPSWPLWGGTGERNLVNLVEKNIASAARVGNSL